MLRKMFPISNGMDHLSGFLAKFGKLQNPRKKREEIAEILSAFLVVSIDQKDIQLKKNILYLNSSSIPKTEIFLQKESLLQLLKEKIPNIPITDIR